jgi:putative transposase
VIRGVSTKTQIALVGISRSGNAYQTVPDRHARLRERLITLSGKHRRYGYLMLHAKLVREGFRANVKVVARLYSEERRPCAAAGTRKSPRACVKGPGVP